MKGDRKIKNVVPIMLDTLQFNYLGCYGNTRGRRPRTSTASPTEGVVFENAYT